jgi:hypothetical protein
MICQLKERQGFRRISYSKYGETLKMYGYFHGWHLEYLHPKGILTVALIESEDGHIWGQATHETELIFIDL